MSEDGGGEERRGGCWLHALLVFAFLYLPIAVLIIYSFNGDGVGGFPPRHLTLDWYRMLFGDGAIWDSVVNSLLVAFAAMAIALGFGIPAALALDRAQLSRQGVVPPPGAAAADSAGHHHRTVAAHAVRHGGMKLSLLTIMLGHGTALISVATTEVFAGLQKLDRAQEEASLDLGANYWQTFWRVTVPNLKLPIIGAALLIFTLSMDEIAVSFFLIGRDNTLPLEIWARLRRGITPEINAISTIIFVFSLVAIVMWYRLRVRSEVQPEIAAELMEAAVTRGLNRERESQRFHQVRGGGSGGGGMSGGSFAVGPERSDGSPAETRDREVDGEDNKICHQVRDGQQCSRGLRLRRSTTS